MINNGSDSGFDFIVSNHFSPSHGFLAIVVRFSFHSILVVHLAIIDILIELLGGRTVIFILAIDVVLENFAEVFNADLAVLVLISHFVEDLLLIWLNRAKLQLFKDIAESVHGQEACLIDIEQVESLLDWVKLLNHSI